MKSVTLAISLTLKGPLLSQSSSPGELGLDSVVARHKDNTPYLPGTLIIGNLRQSLEELTSIDTDFNPPLQDWLGEASLNSVPKSKRLFFSDFRLDRADRNKLQESHIRDRITVDPETGAVKAQHILMMENPFVTGEQYIFTGNLHFFAADHQVAEILDKVKTGFNWFTQLGSMKSIGFGLVEDVSFSEESIKVIPPLDDSSADVPETIGLVIKPRYPLCMSSDARKSTNLFESNAIISGGAIIGSIATSWHQLMGETGNEVTESLDPERNALCKHFSRLQISHAFASPLSQGKRPLVAPLSLCQVGDDANTFYDVANVSSPCLIKVSNKQDQLTAEPPAFALDWKQVNAPQQCYPWPYLRFSDWGWASVDTDLRVRTQIDPVSKRSSEGELFAYELILPNEQGDDAFAWYAEINLSRIPIEDRAAVYHQLKSLLSAGIIGLSKTNTPADIEFVENLNSVFANGPNHTESQWAITLQTDTLLGSTEALGVEAQQADLEAMYKSVWEDLSDGKLTLTRYFARQKFSGSEYRKNVFQKTEKYRPWLLTEAGSVFILEAKDESAKQDALDMLKKWQQQGLPLAKSTLEYYQINEDQSQQWRDCPYVPQNGYGEIAVDIAMPENIISLDDQHRQLVLIHSEASITAEET